MPEELSHEQMKDELHRFDDTFPSLPKGVHISDETRELYNNLKAQAEVLPRGRDRNEVLFTGRELVAEINATVGANEKPLGPTKFTTQFINPDHRLVVREVDQHGNVQDHVASKEDTEAAEARVKEIIDAREDVSDLRASAKNYRELAYEAERAGSAVAADQLFQEADALEKQASEKLEHLKETVPPKDWSSYKLGHWTEPEPNVEAARQLLKAGKAVEFKELINSGGLTRGELYRLQMSLTPAEQAVFNNQVLPLIGSEEMTLRRI